MTGFDPAIADLDVRYTYLEIGSRRGPRLRIERAQVRRFTA